MKTAQRLSIATAMVSALAGCYVVPINHPAVASTSVGSAQGAVPIQLAPLTARLYPANDAAAPFGRLSGTISRPERGHGVFSLTVGNETYTGEATRAPNSPRGSANAAGSQGGFLKCDYTMNNASIGTGTCVLSNGARFDMHISS